MQITWHDWNLIVYENNSFQNSNIPNLHLWIISKMISRICRTLEQVLAYRQSINKGKFRRSQSTFLTNRKNTIKYVHVVYWDYSLGIKNEANGLSSKTFGQICAVLTISESRTNSMKVKSNKLLIMCSKNYFYWPEDILKHF